ncbi:hypothetical protein Tco_1570011 [Tanacetum coccineum]
MLLHSLPAILHLSSLLMSLKCTCINSGILYTSMIPSTDSRLTRRKDFNTHLFWKSSDISSRICPRIQGRDFDCLPFKEDSYLFLRDLAVEKITPTITSERTGDKSGVLDVAEDDSTESDFKSWGNHEDDSNDEQESKDESSEQENESEEQESDDSEQEDESDDDDQEEEDFFHTPSPTNDKDDENLESKSDEVIKSDEEKGLDDTDYQLMRMLNARLNETHSDWINRLLQGEGVDAEMMTVNKGLKFGRLIKKKSSTTRIKEQVKDLTASDFCPRQVSTSLQLVANRQGIKIEDTFVGSERGLKNEKTNPKSLRTTDLDWLKDMVPNIWSPVKVAYDKYALWGISHWREQLSDSQFFQEDDVADFTIALRMFTKKFLSYLEAKTLRGFIDVDDFDEEEVDGFDETVKVSVWLVKYFFLSPIDITKNITGSKIITSRTWSTLEKKRVS